MLKALKMDKVPTEDISRSEEELRMIVSASEQGGKLDHMESRLLDNVLILPTAWRVKLWCRVRIWYACTLKTVLKKHCQGNGYKAYALPAGA